MASEPLASSPPEFRRYRRFLSWFLLAFISLGSAYLLGSVGLTIYRRRYAVPTGAPVGMPATPADLESCAEELADVQLGLERHLENFHRLLARYSPAGAQDWDENRGFWLGHWKAAGDRCRFSQPHPGPAQKEWDELAGIHLQLAETEIGYTKELLRFGRVQAPRLAQIRKRLELVNSRIGAAAAPAPRFRRQTTMTEDHIFPSDGNPNPTPTPNPQPGSRPGSQP